MLQEVYSVLIVIHSIRYILVINQNPNTLLADLIT
jgi:hypothetical protein